jgi:hypothetical protein
MTTRVNQLVAGDLRCWMRDDKYLGRLLDISSSTSSQGGGHIETSYTLTFEHGRLNSLDSWETVNEVKCDPLKRRSHLLAYRENLFNPGWRPVAAPPAPNTFEPIWVKRPAPYNDWVVKCPLCGYTSGSDHLSLQHPYTCPNKGKIPDLSERPSEGGKRRRSRSRSQSRSRSRSQSRSRSRSRQPTLSKGGRRRETRRRKIH